MKKILCFFLMVTTVIVASVASAGIMVIPYVTGAVVGDVERAEAEVLGRWETMAVVEVAGVGEDLRVYSPDGFLGKCALFPSSFMRVEGVNLELMSMLHLSDESDESDATIASAVLERLLSEEMKPLLFPYHSDVLPSVSFVEGELDLAVQGYGNEENADGKWVLTLPDDGTPVTITNEWLTRALGGNVDLTFSYVSWDEVLANMEYATPEAEATIRDWLTEQGIELEPTA